MKLTLHMRAGERIDSFGESKGERRNNDETKHDVGHIIQVHNVKCFNGACPIRVGLWVTGRGIHDGVSAKSIELFHLIR